METATRLPLTELPVRSRGCCQTLADPLPEQRVGVFTDVMRALSDPTRLQMVHMLKAAPEPVCVCDFVAAFDLGQPTVSHHLAKLREAGLVDSFKRGLWAFYTLRDDLPGDTQQIIALI